VNILIVPDKFKGSLTAVQVCDVLASALYKINSSYNIVTVPLADGGEGTCELLTQISKGSQIYLEAFDPLMRKIETSYGISGKVAFISMAAASGLEWLKPDERNCKITSTFGTGQMIKLALDNGADEIIMGIGGSATNDAGMGMGRALGYQLIGDNGDLEGIGAELLQLKKIVTTGAHPRIKQTKYTVICDVDNEL
jgi:glycerate kinase